MSGIIETIYDVAFLIWNGFINTAVTVFTTSLKDAKLAGLYSTAKTAFDAIVDCTVPLATLFFIIAIYKTISSTPPEQQARKFMLDVLKYGMILFIASQLWNIMGYVIDFSDGITDAIASGDASAEISTGSDNVLYAKIEEDMDFDFGDYGITEIGQAISDAISFVIKAIIYLIGGVVSILVLAAAGLTVIGVAFERIIKPLVILPFSTIVLGIGACSGEGERMMWHYGKSFLSFCISGAFMITAIKLGSACIDAFSLADAIGTDDQGLLGAVVTVVQVDLTAIVITGLLKSMDSVVAKVFG